MMGLSEASLALVCLSLHVLLTETQQRTNGRRRRLAPPPSPPDPPSDLPPPVVRVGGDHDSFAVLISSVLVRLAPVKV